MENKTKQTKKSSQLFRIIRISLIIHIILAIIFLLFAFKQGPIKNIAITAKKEPRIEYVDERPAALKPRKSEFGIAPFDNEAQFKKPVAKIAGPEKLDGTTQQKKTSQKEKNIKKISSKKQTQKKMARKRKPLKIKTTKAKTKIITSKDKEEKTQDIKTTEEQKDPLNKEAALRQAQGDRAIKEKVEINQDDEKAEQPKIEKFKTLGIDLKDTIPDVKPKKSIIGMTKGFIENLRHKGDDWLERDGDENKRPSYEELKYMSYEKTIQWHLQQSRNINFNKSKATWNNKIVHIQFIIDKNGNIYDIKLAESSGDSELDEQWMKIIKQASPFPPLPEHFKTEYYNTGRICTYGQNAINF